MTTDALTADAFAFDMSSGVTGAYEGRASHAQSYPHTKESLSQLIQRLYSADVVITFSGDSGRPDYDLGELQRVCARHGVDIDLCRFDSNYRNMLGIIWKCNLYDDCFGRGLDDVFKQVIGRPVPTDIPGLSNNDHVRDAQIDAYQAFCLWRAWTIKTSTK